LKLFAYHNGYNGISQYRVWNPLEYLSCEKNGLPRRSERVQIPLEGECNIPGIGSHQDIADWADVVFTPFNANLDATNRITAIQAYMKAKGKKGVVIDLDDDIFSIQKDNGNYAAYHRSKEWFKEKGLILVTDENREEAEQVLERIGGGYTTIDGKQYLALPVVDPKACVIDQITQASGITVSTKTLAGVYGKYNRNIQIVPNCIDFKAWGENKTMKDGFVRIGLFGANAHYKDWEIVKDVIEQILNEHENVIFVFNSWLAVKKKHDGEGIEQMEKQAYVPDFLEKLINHPRTEFYEPCEIDEWPAWLASRGCDIGLAPLVDSNFNAGKSNLKWLEYSALKVPGVYANVPAFENVRHGVNGLKATKPNDYYKALRRLIMEQGLREDLAGRAYKDVRENYCAEKGAALLESFCRGL